MKKSILTILCATLLMMSCTKPEPIDPLIAYSKLNHIMYFVMLPKYIISPLYYKKDTIKFNQSYPICFNSEIDTYSFRPNPEHLYLAIPPKYEMYIDSIKVETAGYCPTTFQQLIKYQFNHIVK